MSNNKNARELLNLARSYGFTVKEGRHSKVYDGNRMVTSISRTAGDSRNAQNVKAQLRRAVQARDERNST